MNRVIFDMNSTDTFNRNWYIELFFKDGKKKVEWPPWLIGPIHYLKKETVNE